MYEVRASLAENFNEIRLILHSKNKKTALGMMALGRVIESQYQKAGDNVPTANGVDTFTQVRDIVAMIERRLARTKIVA